MKYLYLKGLETIVYQLDDYPNDKYSVNKEIERHR